MQYDMNYLNDEALEKLIEEAENEIIAAPDYLEKMILRKAERYEIKESVEIIPIRHAFRGKTIQTTPSKRAQLFIYSMKVAAGAAAAIALTIFVPIMKEPSDLLSQGGRAEITKEKADWEEKQEIYNLNERASDFCGNLFRRTNELLFGKELER